MKKLTLTSAELEACIAACDLRAEANEENNEMKSAKKWRNLADKLTTMMDGDKFELTVKQVSHL